MWNMTLGLGLDLIFHLGILALCWTAYRQLDTAFSSFLRGAILLASMGGLLSLICGGGLFGSMRLLGWLLFVYLPCFSLLAGHRLDGDASLLGRGLRLVSTRILPASVMMIGIWAYLVEPYNLTVQNVEISSPKLDRAVRVAVVADLQTDHVGDYERAALQAVLDAEPDLILLTGDYIQAAPSKRSGLYDELQTLLNELEFDAPLGVFAVQGDVDPPGWQSIFDGTSVQTWLRTTSVDMGGFRLTGLAPQDSRMGLPAIAESRSFHILFGHAPDFALEDPPADLLIAGHTHGGQVQLPFIGPLLTLSRVPRSWASGVTELPTGQTLVVSRGIGMERGRAPRIRFLCPPEVVILDLKPAP